MLHSPEPMLADSWREWAFELEKAVALQPWALFETVGDQTCLFFIIEMPLGERMASEASGSEPWSQICLLRRRETDEMSWALPNSYSLSKYFSTTVHWSERNAP